MQRPVDLDKAVAAYGGYTNLAKRLNLSVSTVHGWKLRRNLPKWRGNAIAVVAKRDKKDVFGKDAAAPKAKKKTKRKVS
jgi:uncharacterized protein YjcR